MKERERRKLALNGKVDMKEDNHGGAFKGYNLLMAWRCERLSITT